jgi:putative transcriptional regulator
MANHPNRSRRGNNPARNPTPAEIMIGRKSENLTQTEAAMLLYCPQNTWQRWEHGLRRMHPAFWELFNIKKGPAGRAKREYLASRNQLHLGDL